MKKIFGPALFVLVFPLYQLDAGEPAAETATGLVVISNHDYALLRRDARETLGALSGRSPDARALVDAITAETDPVAREALWNAWLEEISVAADLGPVELEALYQLQKDTPVTGVPHHEFPSRSMPAFAISAKAAALLAKHRKRLRARHLATRPGELAIALQKAAGSIDFAAGLKALEFVSPEHLSLLVAAQLERDPFENAASILLKAAEIEPVHANLLSHVVRQGDATSARRAVRLAMDIRTPELLEIAMAALTRSELGGLALTAARRAGMHPDQFCWTLLGDPAMGADAARMLASDSERLTDEISKRLPNATELARLRMLLALRLNGTDAARQLLAELVDAAWLSDQQRRELQSWL